MIAAWLLNPDGSAYAFGTDTPLTTVAAVLDAFSGLPQTSTADVTDPGRPVLTIALFTLAAAGLIALALTRLWGGKAGHADLCRPCEDGSVDG